MSKSAKLTLYTRPGCHLCARALELLQRQGINPLVQDISRDLDLLRAYGTRIPVLKRADTGDKLQWPFDQATLKAFLR